MSITHNPKFIEYCRTYKRKFKLLNWYETAEFLLTRNIKKGEE